MNQSIEPLHINVASNLHVRCSVLCIYKVNFTKKPFSRITWNNRTKEKTFLKPPRFPTTMSKVDDDDDDDDDERGIKFRAEQQPSCKHNCIFIPAME